MLYAADADGSNVKKIWEAPMSVDGVCFSPDGRELTVSLWTSKDSSRLWRLKSNGEGAHPLLPDWPATSEQWGAQWTPDGRHFVFTSDREGVPNVYELLAPRWFEFWRKPTAIRITGNQIPIAASAPARDSNHLFVLGTPLQGAMQALDPRTGQLEPYLGGLSASEFVISPDRQWMAYTEFPTGNLWKSKIDGSHRIQLTNSGVVMERWSPDGKSLVYDADAYKLYLVSADGGTPEKLIATGEHEINPTWSPDGKSIAFSYYNFTDQPEGGIFTVDLASHKVSMTPNTQGFTAPSWSPNGKYLVVFAQKPSRLMLYSANTGKWKELTQFHDPAGHLTWSSDSEAIYMGMIKGNDGIYRIAVPDGKWTKVSDLGGTYTGEYTGGGGPALVSLTADGQPAMMASTGVSQIYSLQWKP